MEEYDNGLRIRCHESNLDILVQDCARSKSPLIIGWRRDGDEDTSVISLSPRPV